jgi:hypothetical protein
MAYCTMKEHDIDQMLNTTGFHRAMTKTLCLAFFLVLCLTGQDFPRPLYNISILHICTYAVYIQYMFISKHVFIYRACQLDRLLTLSHTPVNVLKTHTDISVSPIRSGNKFKDAKTFLASSHLFPPLINYHITCFTYLWVFLLFV